MIEMHESVTLARLAVNDARAIQDAGAEFARDMTTTKSTDFTLELAELQDHIRRAVAEAGFSAEQAWLAAEHFKVAARDEWERIRHTAGA